MEVPSYKEMFLNGSHCFGVVLHVTPNYCYNSEKKDPRPPKCQSLTSTGVRTYSQKQKPILEKALLAAMFSVETMIM